MHTQKETATYYGQNVIKFIPSAIDLKNTQGTQVNYVKSRQQAPNCGIKSRKT